METKTITSEVHAHIETLVRMLTEHGFKACVLRDSVVQATNPAAEPPGGDRMARTMFVGLGQEVTCIPREGGDGSLWWHWMWSGPTRGAPAELDLLCPAGDLDTAANRIAAVLAMRSEEEPGPMTST